MHGRALHLRGTARRHRERLRTCGRDDRRRRPRPACARALPRRPHGARPPRRRPGLRPGARGARRRARRPARRARSPTSTRRSSPTARDALAPALVLAPPPAVCRTMGDKYLAHEFFVAHGIPSPRTWLPADVPDDARYPLLVKVREGFGSRHIYRADDEAQLRVPPRLDPGRLDGAGALPRRGVLDRRLLRRRRRGASTRSRAR